MVFQLHPRLLLWCSNRKILLIWTLQLITLQLCRINHLLGICRIKAQAAGLRLIRSSHLILNQGLKLLTPAWDSLRLISICWNLRLRQHRWTVVTCDKIAKFTEKQKVAKLVETKMKRSWRTTEDCRKITATKKVDRYLMRLSNLETMLIKTITTSIMILAKCSSCINTVR